MKLPIILSAMITALAIPASFASEATEETKTEAAAPEAEAAKPAAKMKGKKRKAEPMMDAEGKPMHKKKHHRRGSGKGHPKDAYDLAFDDPNFPRGSDGSGCSAEPASHGKILPPEVPGQKGPDVPAGQ